MGEDPNKTLSSTLYKQQKLTAAYEALRKRDSLLQAMKKNKMKTEETQETQHDGSGVTRLKLSLLRSLCHIEGV
jgi:hypothetical protein